MLAQGRHHASPTSRHPGIREADLSRTAVKQARTKPVLDGGEIAAEHRHRPPQRPSGLGQAASIRDFDKQTNKHMHSGRSVGPFDRFMQQTINDWRVYLRLAKN